MKTILSAEQREFAAALRALLAAENPVSLVRTRDEPGADRRTPALWKALADAGVFGLAIAEEYGGAGGTLDDLAVFYTEAGRALCPTTVHSSVHAALAVDRLGSPEAKAAWLPPLASGSVRATTALWNARDAALGAPTLRADATPNRWRLNGTADYVADADVADLIVVSAASLRDTAERTLVFVVDAHAGGVSIEPLDMVGGHRAFTVRFDDTPVADDAVLDGVTAAGLRWLANSAVALGSLDLVGVGQAVLDRTVDYTKLRHQFGRPIASFQAAQHLIADMHIALAAARLASHAAVFWLGRGRTASRETAIARIHAATAARLITLDAHQLHGGMGYVTETDLHLFSERARLGATLGGGADVAASWLEETMREGSAGE
ncbi:acyl-CoA dehydrogenase family protein [Mycobacterium marseillense]|jgi:alkylation response protein AidB-like acyl-CoA dehydrogenase|uniref:Acyl-CoA dehydrogenase n=1 Tax=Mycobacterium marseillense TaxID=701042 RepID=A0AAC9VUG8_9MYCO|nr:acyl-CoA dehydrogenase family protein [Mycobacterium marseillense]ASW90674.1 acyl-CoA dehydrogenase [Mycobacterium marseillense]MCA2265663.1 acyl-CoA/acyl-ACP dehydrogenase [Mycobacterium marseillense]MCV7405513.1 acyl-CoA/acyl-ACP dehydrogenase [Mycobacterium marseillense]OBJ67322.1 acyl-CoA dehydrogenase [Mycobacterium marseillense]ORA91650.1 acyl-CoA dehydrogenase [Mycobacterium marseillense]